MTALAHSCYLKVLMTVGAEKKWNLQRIMKGILDKKTLNLHSKHASKETKLKTISEKKPTFNNSKGLIISMWVFKDGFHIAPNTKRYTSICHNMTSKQMVFGPRNSRNCILLWMNLHTWSEKSLTHMVAHDDRISSGDKLLLPNISNSCFYPPSFFPTPSSRSKLVLSIKIGRNI